MSSRPDLPQAAVVSQQPSSDAALAQLCSELGAMPVPERRLALDEVWRDGPHRIGQLAAFLGLEAAFSTSEIDAWHANFGRASFAECERRGALIAYPDSTSPDGVDRRHAVALVFHDPFALDAHAWFEPLIECDAPTILRRLLVRREDFASLMRAAERNLRALDSLRATAPDGARHASDALVLSMSTIESTASSTVRLVDSTLYDALKAGASDIHFELQQTALVIRYRLDGVLQEVKRIESIDAAHQVVSRIKVLSELDIAERRTPQDGRFGVQLDGRDIDFRVSIMPNVAGEDAVLRILDRKHLTEGHSSLTLDALSFSEDVKQFVRQSARLPYGLLLVTGPTGSGKTTTLYAALSEINSGLDKIVTIEDPIEYQLSGVLQIPVNERKGLTFARGLRSILRHDPDKIMVGEIRDSETAQIAVQAALTGHQVFTTVHANNVFDVIGRFSNMGVDSYSLVAALTGIMAQRLVRKVCPDCATWQAGGADSPSLALDEGGTRRLRKAGACPNCRSTGYRGRVAIAETLPIDDEMKDMLVGQAPISALKAASQQKGFKSLRESALSLAALGLTTLDEVNRVTPVH